MQPHTIDTRWVKFHSVRKFSYPPFFYIASLFLCVTLRLCASALKSTAVFRFNGGLEPSRHHHHAGLYADHLPYVAYVHATRYLCCGSFCRLLTAICRLLITICRLMSSIGRQIIQSWRQTSLPHRQVSPEAQLPQELAHYWP